MTRRRFRIATLMVLVLIVGLVAALVRREVEVRRLRVELQAARAEAEQLQAKSLERKVAALSAALTEIAAKREAQSRAEATRPEGDAGP